MLGFIAAQLEVTEDELRAPLDAPHAWPAGGGCARLALVLKTHVFNVASRAARLRAALYRARLGGGLVVVEGDASQYAGATGHGGLLVIRGSAASRCGISLKGLDIVVGGSIGHMSAFMAQSGRMVVLGDAGEALGDSIYEARIYVRGTVKSLGTDCVEKPMRDEHRAEVADLLAAAGIEADPADFRRYGSARKLYHFDVDHADAY